MIKLSLAFFTFFIFIHFSFGQCSSCTVTINGNNTPVGTMSHGSVVCISGDRTDAINFNNRNNISICISDNSSWNGLATSLSGLSSIDNYGSLEISNDFNGNWTISNHNFLTFNTNLSSNKTLNNFGSMSAPGSMTFSSNSTFYSSGTLDISGSVNFNSNAEVVLQGNSSIGGAVTINSNTNVDFSGSLNIDGNLQINSNGGLNAINSNQCLSLTVNGSFSNSGSIFSNYLSDADAPLYVNKTPTNNAIVGGFSVGTCPAYDCFETQQISTTDGIDVVYIYKCPDEFIVPALEIDQIILDVQVAVVGGGAGGGRGESAGGGGAGEIKAADGLSLTIGQIYPVAVGSGGPGSGSTTEQGQDGYRSSFFGITSLGGGGGGSSSSSARNGRPGGSGGGGGANNNPGQGEGSKGAKIGTIGNDGGNGKRQNSNQRTGGGGGGAGSAGENGANNHPGDGGNGIGLDILIGVPGINNAFSGGGGSTGRNPAKTYGENSDGGSYNGIDLGGTGGGDDNSGVGVDGLRNTGSGGGAGNLRAGPGASGLIIIRISYRILPADFLEMAADFDEKERQTKVKWTTGKELENSHFEIERSDNGSQDFIKIGEITGSGWKDTSTKYDFHDKNLPLSSGIFYYRIKQVDFNGGVRYSKILSVQTTGLSMTDGFWRAYPNPSTQNQLKIGLLDRNMHVDEKIYFKIHHHMSLSNEYSVDTEDQLNDILYRVFPTLPKGLLIFEIKWGNNTEYIKVFKQ